MQKSLGPISESPICCRLDRFLLSEGWLELFPFGHQEVMVRALSDHCPALFHTKPPKWGPALFRFDNSWFENKDLLRNLNIWWEEDDFHSWEGYQFMRKLRNFQQKVKGWSMITVEAPREKKHLKKYRGN